MATEKIMEVLTLCSMFRTDATTVGLTTQKRQQQHKSLFSNILDLLLVESADAKFWDK